MNFKCDKCGACCRNLQLFGSLYADLDRGDGICRFFNTNTNLCSIYESRPLKCNISAGYKNYFSSITYDEYISKTEAGCRFLKKITKLKQNNK